MSRKPKNHRGRAQENNRPQRDIAPSREKARPRNPYLVPAVCGLLLLAVLLVFSQTAEFTFVNYDDNTYVYENPHVSAGLTADNAAWAFTHSHSDNWHPLTWLSHMMDCQFFGLAPRGHHLTNVALHAAAVVLLFLVLLRMTDRLWPSVFVAVVFAIHPLRVESVAWVAERKDVLSGLFFMLTLWTYSKYAERPTSWGRYIAVIVCFALGLMAKPMLVTVPFVLLLLDYWPLGRMKPPPTDYLQRLVIEKTPLIVMAIASCEVTLMAQAGAMQPLGAIPLPSRIANALVSYATYLIQFIFPVNLAAFYPHPGATLPVWEVGAALLLLLGVTLAALTMRRKYPYLFVGWLWYLGMLTPVIGLVQVGNQATADRYTYLTQIGLCVALAWGVSSAAAAWPNYRRLVPVAASLIIAVLMVCAWRQTGYWRDSESLWTRALDCTSNNALAHNNLGKDLAERKKMDDAVIQFKKAVDICPDYALAHSNLGGVLASQGQLNDAIGHYRTALAIRPDFASAHNNLGAALARQGKADDAAAEYRKAVESDPDCPEANNNLGSILMKQNRIDAAIACFQKALDANPSYPEAHSNLGAALAKQRQFDKALRHLEEAVRLAPGYAAARQNLKIVRLMKEKAERHVPKSK